MNSPTESMLAADLRELAEGHSHQPDIDAITRRGRALRRRRVVFASTGGTAAVAAAAVIGLVVAAGPSPAAGTGTPTAAAGGTSLTPSRTTLTAEVTAAFHKAEANSELTVTGTFDWGTSKSVTVPSQGWQADENWNSAGVPQIQSFVQRVPGTGQYSGDFDYKILLISMTSHSYHVTNAYVPVGLQTQWFMLPQPESLQTTPYSQVVGSGTLDGQPVYIIAGKGSGGFTDTEWVSKKTLLILKEVAHTKTSGTQVYDYTWSSAAGFEATAAANKPAIPQGFTAK